MVFSITITTRLPAENIVLCIFSVMFVIRYLNLFFRQNSTSTHLFDRFVQSYVYVNDLQHYFKG